MFISTPEAKYTGVTQLPKNQAACGTNKIQSNYSEAQFSRRVKVSLRLLQAGNRRASQLDFQHEWSDIVILTIGLKSIFKKVTQCVNRFIVFKL